MKLSDLKKELKSLNKDELSEIICDLYKSNKAVKDFLHYHLNQSNEKLIDRNKVLIKKAINPESRKLRLAKARKILSDFKKIGAAPEAQAELMFYYLDQGLIYAAGLKQVNDTMMKSILSVFVSLIKLIKAEYMPLHFIDLANKTVENVLGINKHWAEIFQFEFDKHLG